MNSNVNRKVSTKSNLIAFIFLICYLGSSFVYYGFMAMMFRVVSNGLIFCGFSKFLINCVKKYRGRFNVKSIVIYIVCISFIYVFGFAFLKNSIDLLFNNRVEIVSNDYFVSRVRKSRGRRRGNSYDYYLYFKDNNIKLEIDSDDYYKMNEISNDNVNLRVLYWKYSKVIDVLEFKDN